MNEGGKILNAMASLLSLFASRCKDRTTIDKLAAMVDDTNSWSQAHKLFQEIRHKNLEATKKKNKALEAQYCFEEVCAKTLYNLSGASAPFDADSPYWVVPNAIAFAKYLKIDETEVIKIVA